MARGKKKETLTPEERLQAALIPESEQPYKVPGNWIWVKVGDLCAFIGGGTPDKTNPLYWNGNISWASVKDIKGSYLYSTIDKISQLGLECSSSNLCEVGDLLLVTRIEPAKAIVSKIVTSINQDLKIVKSELSSLFLYYYFCTFQHEFEKKAGGSTVKGITLANIQNTPFPLPPLPEQQRIVDRIESLFAKLDEAKQKAQDALDSFETRKAAILHKAFTGELIGKHLTATINLEEIATCIRIGPFGSSLHKEDYILGGVPVVNPKHIVKQKIVPEEKTTVSVQKAEELSSYILQENDIILGRRGDMGRSAPVTDLETGWLCGTGSMIIRLKSGYNAKFYSQIIASQAAVRYLEENSVGSTMKNLNEKIVRLLPIPDFTVEEQLEIVCILDDLLAKEQQAKEAAEKVLDQIDLIKKSILARAFRGELGTNDPNEESAVELLKQGL